MTLPPDPQMTLMQASLAKVSEDLKDLTRAIQGDASTGSPSIRKALDDLRTDLKADIKGLRQELETETDSTNDRVDRVEADLKKAQSDLRDRVQANEQKARDQDNYLKGMTTVIRWAGGGTLLGLVGLIGQLAGLWGHK